MKKVQSACIVLALAIAAWSSPFAMAQTPAPSGAQPRNEVVAGRNTLRFIPASPRALIVLFHGSGGSETYATNEATQRALAPFLAAGYGFVSSASAQRVEPRRWDLSALDAETNVDVAYMLALYRRLIDAGEITAETPIFTMGMSNGGGMANLFGLALRDAGAPIRGIADYMGPFPIPVRSAVDAGARPAPTFVVTGERDGLVSAASVLAEAERLGSLGVRIETHFVRESRLTPSDFSTIGGFDEPNATRIFSDLVAKGIVAPSGQRLFRAGQPTITRDDQAALGDQLSGLEESRSIVRTLLTVWGAHMMRSDFSDEQFAFFEAALGHPSTRP